MFKERGKENREGLESVKALMLVGPELGEKYEVKTESPFFVSIFILSAFTCDNCDTEYKPLLYSANGEISPHHFHEDCGGIYIEPDGLETARLYGWVARLQPKGKFSKKTMSSEQVDILGFQVFCRGGLCQHEPLNEGVVFADFDDEEALMPGCLESLNDSLIQPRIRYNFKNESSGAVLFSQV